MKLLRCHLILVGLAVASVALSLFPFPRRIIVASIQMVKGRKTVGERVAQFGPAVHERLAPEFARIGVAYPPRRLILAGLKQERRLEVWVSDPPQLLKSYPILGASGTLGPKLQEGDHQVPEGLYRIESLNPNSLFHLALRVDYPNAFDVAQGRLDGRQALGSDIMIHGKRSSIGCLAMGDEAAEELFVLAAETGIENISVIFSPVDFRVRELPDNLPPLPGWTHALYGRIKAELLRLKP